MSLHPETQRVRAALRAFVMLTLAGSVVGAQEEQAVAPTLPTLRGSAGETLRLPFAYARGRAPGSVRVLGTAPAGALAEAAARVEGEDLLLELTPSDSARRTLAVVSCALGAREASERVDLVVRLEPRARRPFAFGRAGAKDVSVAGSWNGWQAGRDVLERDGEGIFRGEVALGSGVHRYKLVVDGEWLPDPDNEAAEPDGFGGRNSLIRVGAPPSARPRLVRWGIEADSAAGRVVRLGFLPGAGGAGLDPSSLLCLLGDRLGAAPVWDAEREEIRLPVPAGFRGGLRVLARDRAGVACLLRFSLPEDAGDWLGRSIYFCLTDRFQNGDPANDAPLEVEGLDPRANYHGGDFAGIRARLEDGYFEALGVGVLWISPVNRGPAAAFRDSKPPHRLFSNYHGYWPVAARELEPRFGTLEELRSLVAAAHTRGIRVVVDFVANHVHEAHPFYAKHPEWFGTVELPDGRQNVRLYDAYPYTTWFDAFLPSFDYARSPAAIDAMVQSALHWVEVSGIDGFRHDAVKHVPQRFWESLSRALRERVEGPGARELLQVGETIDSRERITQTLAPGALNGAFDFPLYWKVRDFFACGQGSAAELDAAVRASLDVYPEEAIISPLLGNHDFTRFTAFADGDVVPGEGDENELGWSERAEVDDPRSYGKLALAFAFLLTQPGAPLIYYGDEVGLSGVGDPDNRRPMRFGEALSAAERSLLARVGALGRLRRGHASLRVGDYLPLHAEGGLLAYARTSCSEVALVLLNRDEAARELTLDLRALGLPGGAWREPLAEGTVQSEGESLNLQLPALSARVLIRPR